MQDDFLPEEMTLDAAASGHLQTITKKKGYKKTADHPRTLKTANWAPQVGVHRVAWNNVDLGKGGWVASGSASGLGRVDMLQGRFVNGKIPVQFRTEREDDPGHEGGDPSSNPV